MAVTGEVTVSVSVQPSLPTSDSATSMTSTSSGGTKATAVSAPLLLYIYL